MNTYARKARRAYRKVKRIYKKAKRWYNKPEVQQKVKTAQNSINRAFSDAGYKSSRAVFGESSQRSINKPSYSAQNLHIRQASFFGQKPKPKKRMSYFP